MAHDRIVFGVYTWNFARLTGQPQVPMRKLKIIKMPGVDGMAFKFQSLEATAQRVKLEAVAVDEADEYAWIAAMGALCGQQVSLYTGTGIAHHNQVFHEVVHEDSQKITVGSWYGVNLGSDARLLTFSATVQYPYGG